MAISIKTRGMEAQPTRHRNWKTDMSGFAGVSHGACVRDELLFCGKNSEAALADFEDGSLDYVYIDGNHLYEFVKKDLELSLRKVKSGGYITGDDYGPGGWWNGGVKKAVDEIAWREKEVTLLWIRGGQFVLLKKCF